MSLYWKKTNLKGAATGIITGALVVLVWEYVPFAGKTISEITGLYSLVAGFAISLILIVIVSLATGDVSEEMMKEFDDVVAGNVE